MKRRRRKRTENCFSMRKHNVLNVNLMMISLFLSCKSCRINGSVSKSWIQKLENVANKYSHLFNHFPRKKNTWRHRTEFVVDEAKKKLRKKQRIVNGNYSFSLKNQIEVKTKKQIAFICFSVEIKKYPDLFTVPQCSLLNSWFNLLFDHFSVKYISTNITTIYLVGYFFFFHVCLGVTRKNFSTFHCMSKS